MTIHMKSIHKSVAIIGKQEDRVIRPVFPGQILNSMSYDLPSDPLNVCPG